MTTGEDLVQWNHYWRVNDGVMTCRYCQAQQADRNRGAFTHADDCTRKRLAANPWDELDSICQRLQSKL
jgi:hypothetical protein